MQPSPGVCIAMTPTRVLLSFVVFHKIVPVGTKRVLLNSLFHQGNC